MSFLRNHVWMVFLCLSAVSTAQSLEEQGKYFDSLSGHLSTPLGDTYRHGRQFPLVLELTNAGDEPIPLRLLDPYLRFSINGRDYWERVHSPQWHYDLGMLPPDGSLRETVYLHWLRPPFPEGPGSKIQVRAKIPTNKPIPRSFPGEKYTNVCELTLLDDPCGDKLKAADIPEQWREGMSIAYLEGGSIFWGTFSFELRGKGLLSASAEKRNRIDVMLPAGRIEYTLDQDELNDLLLGIRALGIDRLADTKPIIGTDIRESHFRMAVGPKALYASGELMTEENQAIMELKTMMCKFLDNTLKTRRLNSGKDIKNHSLLLGLYFAVTIEPIPAIASIQDYGHSFVVSSLFRNNKAHSVMLEIRRKEDNRRIARIRFANGLESLLKDDPLAVRYEGLARMAAEQARQIGPVPDGQYLVALYINGLQCGHVKQFTIDSNFKGSPDADVPSCKDAPILGLKELDKLWLNRPLTY